MGRRDSGIRVCNWHNLFSHYGMALLSSYLIWRKKDESREDFLDNRTLLDAEDSTVMVDEQNVLGYERYIENHTKLLDAKKCAERVF